MLFVQFVNGITSASTLLMLALGMAIVFGIMNVVNLAHGELIMIGAYTAYFVVGVFHLPFIVGMLASFLVTGLLGVVIEKTLINKLYGKTAETLLATFALSIILQQTVKMLFGAKYVYVASPVEGRIKVGDAVIPYYNLVIIGVSIMVLLFTYIMFFRTRIGMQIRAITQNRTMTECLGSNVKKIDTFTFAYGAGLAGLAGCLIAPIKTISPFIGDGYITDTFMTVVLGGVNSLIGTFLSSFLMGESISMLSGFISEVFAKILVVVAVIVIIRFRPQGLFVKERR